MINAVPAICEAEGVGGDTVSSLPDDMQGLSRWAETWSPFRGPHCDSQQVTGEHHWKSMSLCSLIVGKKLPCLQHPIISQDSMTFIYLGFFLSSSFSTLSPLWDVLAGWLLDYVTRAGRILFGGTCLICIQKAFLINLRELKAFVCLISLNVCLSVSVSPVVSY